MLPVPKCLCGSVSLGTSLGRGSHGFYLGRLFGFELLLRPLGPLVVCVRRGREEMSILFQSLASFCPNLFCLLPVTLNRLPMDLQAACEGLSRRQQALL